MTAIHPPPPFLTGVGPLHVLLHGGLWCRRLQSTRCGVCGMSQSCCRIPCLVRLKRQPLSSLPLLWCQQSCCSLASSTLFWGFPGDGTPCKRGCKCEENRQLEGKRGWCGGLGPAECSVDDKATVSMGALSSGSSWGKEG